MKELKSPNELYKEEQDKIFAQYLDDVIFSKWRENLSVEEVRHAKKMTPSLELILYPNCNLNCSYCYIANYGEKLNPPIKDEDPNLIIENTRKILLWAVKNQFIFYHLEIFSAEFFIQPTWEKIFEVIYEVCDTNRPFFENILIPTNMSFVNDEKQLERVKYWYDKFKTLDIRLLLSASVEGKYCDPITRQSKDPSNNYYVDEFYRKVFEYSKDYSLGFHPMISSENIGYWKENLKWYLSMMKEYGSGKMRSYKDEITTFRQGTPYLLEVRNDDWTDDTITQFCEFLEFAFEYFLHEVFEDDVDAFVVSLLCLESKHYFSHISRVPFMFHLGGRLSCSIQHTFFVRPRYMDIVPCHRTSYPHYQYGKFKINEENGEIIGLEANNIPLMMKIYGLNPLYSIPKCSSCKYAIFCNNTCLGANYEANGEMFIPAESVCKLYDARYKTIAKLYRKFNVIGRANALNEKENLNRHSSCYRHNMETIVYTEELLCLIEKD